MNIRTSINGNFKEPFGLSNHQQTCNNLRFYFSKKKKKKFKILTHGTFFFFLEIMWHIL
jgi:hypothetical protein